jgi:hypothetical protein
VGEIIGVQITFGPVTEQQAAVLIEGAEDRGGTGFWDFEPTEFMERREDGPPVPTGTWRVEGEGNWGIEDESALALLEVLTEAGVGWDAHQSAKYEYPAFDRCWRPGWKRRREGACDEDGPVVHLRALRKLPPETHVSEVLARFDIWHDAAPLHWTEENPNPWELIQPAGLMVAVG